MEHTTTCPTCNKTIYASEGKQCSVKDCAIFIPEKVEPTHPIFVPTKNKDNEYSI